ncbi:MAG: hypothetical protein ILO42_10050 [Clostridia bacterium]|nr:hypothetical protein [Clostridia bacterium]
MKRVLILVLSLSLLLSLAACGGSGKSDETLARRDDDTTVPDGPVSQQGDDSGAQGIRDTVPITFEVIMQYATTGDKSIFTPHVLTAAEQQQLRASVEANGGQVTFDPDGTIRITGSGTTRLTVLPDGSVEGVDDDGKPFGFAVDGNWPDTELGRSVPKADFKIGMTSDEGDILTVSFTGVTIEAAAEYGKKLAESGFTADAAETDLRDRGIYSYSGSNSDGIRAEFVFMDSAGTYTCGLVVEKPGSADETSADDYPYQPGTSASQTGAEIPPEFAFLFPGGTGSYRIIDNNTFISAEKENATLGDARGFSELCRNNGFTENTLQEYKGQDGSDVHFSVYTKGGLEVHISLNLLGNMIAVDMFETEAQGSAEMPAGTDSWPLSGPLAKLPKPDFGNGFTITEAQESITVTVTGAAASDFSGYVEKMKAAGFTFEPDFEDGPDIKLYEAANSEKYNAYVQFAYGYFSIGIGKMPE